MLLLKSLIVTCIYAVGVVLLSIFSWKVLVGVIFMMWANNLTGKWFPD